MTDKVILYLDTQDFSRFADCLGGRGESDAETALEFLLPLIDSGKVVVPYSMAHISELLQYEGGGSELTYRKASAIERISGSYTFRMFNDLIYTDLIDLAKDMRLLRSLPPRPAGFPLDANGHWHPELGDIIGDLPAKMDRWLDDDLKNELHLPRAARRRIKGGLRRGGMRELLSKGDTREEMRKYQEQMPISDRFIEEDLFRKFLLKQVPRKELEEEMLGEIRRPTQFVKWYFERYDGDKGLPDWMGSMGVEIATILRQLKRDIEGINISPEDRDRFLTRQASEFALGVSRKLFSEAAPKLNKLGLGKRAIDRLLNSPDRASTPTISALSALFIQTVRKHIPCGPNSPKVKDSDGGDIIHALYVPYCHVWRGDASSAELARQTFRGCKTRIVGKLRDLPEALEAAANDILFQVPTLMSS